MTTATPAASNGDRSLDRKLATIAAGRYTPGDFVIADAKDADMAFGARSVGPRPPAAPEPAATPDGAVGAGLYRTRAEYLEAMRALVRQGELDILLTSASNGEALATDGSLDGHPSPSPSVPTWRSPTPS